TSSEDNVKMEYKKEDNMSFISLLDDSSMEDQDDVFGQSLSLTTINPFRLDKGKYTLSFRYRTTEILEFNSGYISDESGAIIAPLMYSSQLYANGEWHDLRLNFDIEKDQSSV